MMNIFIICLAMILIFLAYITIIKDVKIELPKIEINKILVPILLIIIIIILLVNTDFILKLKLLSMFM